MLSLHTWIHNMDCVSFRFCSLNSFHLMQPVFKCSNIVIHYFTDSSFVPPLVYAFMGSSRDIAIGPVAVVSLLLGTLLQSEIDPVKNPVEYRCLAFTATFFAGITQATLGFLRCTSPFRNTPFDAS